MSRKFTIVSYGMVCMFVLLCGAVLFVSQSIPPGAGVCDEPDDLKTLTPGLYGLCVAFNQGHDCEPDFSNMEDPFEGCVPASPKILELYNNKKQPDDPPMPGILPDGCPCFDLNEVVSVPTPYTQCKLDEVQPDGDIFSGVRTEPIAAQVNQTQPLLDSSCIYSEPNADPPVFRFAYVYPSEVQVCRDMIAATIFMNPGPPCP
jgi:hypothetical protein